jgi:hypothetical protein
MPELSLFVSHVSEDRIAAMEIVEELEHRGVRCWIAPRDVHPGRPFDDEIANAIDESWAMLLVFSDRCNESKYIRREVTVAGESNKIVIPFRIEDVQPKRGLRVRLSDLHWIDGFASRERAIDELIRTLRPAKDQPVHEVAVDHAFGQPPREIDKSGAKQSREREYDEQHRRGPPAEQRGSRRVLLGGALAGAGLLGAIGAWVFIVPPTLAPQSTPAPTPVTPAPISPSTVIAPAPAAVVPAPDPSGPASLQQPPPLLPPASVLRPPNGFIFADSDHRYLTRGELQNLSPEQLRIARNEIYARRGHSFRDAQLAAYFAQFSWYTPYNYDVPLNNIEEANVSLIKSMEH